MAYEIGYFLGQAIVVVVCVVLIVLFFKIVLLSIRMDWRVLLTRKKQKIEANPNAVLMPETIPSSLPDPAAVIAISQTCLDKKQVAKARARHDKAAVKIDVRRAEWDAEHKSTPRYAVQLDELRQLCRNLTADGTLDEEEIKSLHRWLASHNLVKHDELAKMLANHLDEVLGDGEISVLESLDVLDLVEALAQGKSFSDMKDWRALAPQIESEPPKVKRRPKKNSPSRVTGNRLDSIRFHYLNAEGKFSDRRVVVRVLDDEYFQGICQSRRALRTFRLDRVVGKITSEDTGEVDDAFGWAETVKVMHKK